MHAIAIYPKLPLRTDTDEDGMIAVIFEVWPASGRVDDYLAIAATLRAELVQIDGFISVERFQSLTEPGKLLSLSFWRDEEAVRDWRNRVKHRESQAVGRAGVFSDYRLRIAAVSRDYGMTDRAEAPEDSRAFHKL
jgi:heme-degrading monooxygenase HmoA